MYMYIDAESAHLKMTVSIKKSQHGSVIECHLQSVTGNGGVFLRTPAVQEVLTIVQTMSSSRHMRMTQHSRR